MRGNLAVHNGMIASPTTIDAVVRFVRDFERSQMITTILTLFHVNLTLYAPARRN